MKDAKQKIVRPSNYTRLTMITGLSSTGDTYTVLRKGSNTQIEFYNFVIQLDQSLRAQYKAGFKKNLIIVFDNASIHKTKDNVALLDSKGYMTVTTPPYTPEMNVVEWYFKIFKTLYARSSLAHW